MPLAPPLIQLQPFPAIIRTPHATTPSRHLKKPLRSIPTASSPLGIPIRFTSVHFGSPLNSSPPSHSPSLTSSRSSSSLLPPAPPLTRTATWSASASAEKVSCRLAPFAERPALFECCNDDAAPSNDAAERLRVASAAINGPARRRCCRCVLVAKRTRRRSCILVCGDSRISLLVLGCMLFAVCCWCLRFRNQHTALNRNK